MMDTYTEDKSYIYNGTESCPIFTNRHSIPKSKEKSIRNDLKKLELPVNIINSACEVHRNMPTIGTRRGKSRKKLIFYCAYIAYENEGQPVDHNWLAKICGLPRSSITKAQSMCSEINSGYTKKIIKHSPKGYIPRYYNKLSSEIEFPEGSLEYIYKLTDEVLEKSYNLRDAKPHTVAAAIIVYYMKSNCMILDKKYYKSIFEQSDMTINNVLKEVAQADNE